MISHDPDIARAIRYASACGLNVDTYSFADSPMPDAFENPSFGDVAHLGAWVYFGKPCLDAPHIVHEVSHWLLADAEQRSGLNYEPVDPAGEWLLDEQDADAVTIDTYVLHCLFGPDVAWRWAEFCSVYPDTFGSKAEALAEGRRLFREVTGAQSPAQVRDLPPERLDSD